MQLSMSLLMITAILSALCAGLLVAMDVRPSKQLTKFTEDVLPMCTIAIYYIAVAAAVLWAFGA